ncbi:efflux RND transporter permease subunit [Shewanella canadensis]|uniref:Efflux RND transporter permease subunit n=1 Tax=Shewanella canadensis TaxID=271096 RepID=A0A431WZR3_9GAMM|nr:efflux RND transporter permease subunit [Shewanella canadensis]RTR40978.1 efflux RND transporter permease subunit [Shewanella canadensis]
MHRFYAFFVNRPLVVNVIMLLAIVGGFIGMNTMRVDTMPKFDLGIVNITTFRPGASSEDMELSVTVAIEEELLNVDGINKLVSNSMEGMSVVVAHLDQDEKDHSKITADIQKAVDRASSKLPADLPTKPLVEELSSSSVPVIELCLSGEVPEQTLRQTAKKLERGLRDVDGIAGVDLVGYRNREMKLFIHPEKLYRLGISYNEIINAIQSRNLRDSGGSIESFGADKKVLTVGQFEDPKDVEDVIVRANGLGNYVRVSDIATVILDYSDWDIEARCDGSSGISLLPRKKSQIDGMIATNAVKDYVEDIRKTLPDGMQLTMVNDISRFTKDMLKVLKNNAVMGFFLVLAVLFIFFQFRLALWVSLGLPVAFCITFALMPVFGLNIDMLTLYAMILMLGMLVDDAIVTGEAIFAKRELGLSWQEAAAAGASSVSLPVLVSTLTTILVFLPLAALGGIEGKLMWALPMMVTLILFASLFECQTLLPAHLAHGGDSKPKEKKWVTNLQNRYRVFIEKAVARRYLTISIFILATAVIISVSSQMIRFNLYPETDIDAFWVKVELPEGASFNETREKIAFLESHLRTRIPDYDLLNITAQIGHHDMDLYGATEGRNPAWALLTVYMKLQGERKSNSNDIIAQLRQDVKEMEGFKELSIKPMDDSPVQGQPVEIEVIGNDEQRYIVADSLSDFLMQHPAVLDNWTSYKPGKDIVRLSLNHEALADKRLTVADVTQAVRIGFDGVIIDELQLVGEKIDYRLQFQPQDQGKLATLMELGIMTPAGKSVPLRSLAVFKIEPGEASIKHYLGDRTITIYASIARDKISTSQINDEIAQYVKSSSLLIENNKVRLFFGGELEQEKAAMGGLETAALISMLCLFLLFVLLFHSFTQPFLIMSVIPFGITGVFIGFALQNLDLSMLALIGIIGLTGVLVNDSTVMLHSLNRKRKELSTKALSDQQLAYGAATRLRPIMITSITTIAGLAPAAYELGGANPFMTPMIMAMLWGIMFGTLVTLVLLPCLYSAEQDLRRVAAKLLNKERQLNSAPASLPEVDNS